MSLQKKILDLRLHAALAEQVAFTWQKVLDTHGEDKATAFYQHLGLNHLPAKSYDYDGLTLSREPKPHEALQVKVIASAQESAKERLSTMMLAIRNELVSAATGKLEKLAPAKYHTLIVTVDKAGYTLLRDLVNGTFDDGRLLIQTQRGSKATCSISNATHKYHFTDDGLMSACTCKLRTKADDDDLDLDDELDTLTSITTSRLANDVQARITGAASRYALLGQLGTQLINSVTNDIRSGSVAYIDRAATGLANRTLNLGRSAEASRYEWQRVEYSCLLDSNACGPCAEADGEEATDEADLTPAPNPECEGYDNCRCFHVWVQD